MHSLVWPGSFLPVYKQSVISLLPKYLSSPYLPYNMHFLFTLLLICTLVASSVSVPSPQQRAILQPLSDLEQGNSSNRIAITQDAADVEADNEPPRAAAGERCGPGMAKCHKHLCCSAAGFCGITPAHCFSPDCQIGYGTCDADKTPQGLPTQNLARPRLGSVPYGVAVSSCKVPHTFAMTFDDGPNEYTSDLLDILDKFGAKATFFVTGVNSGKGQIDDFTYPWGKLIQRMNSDGHQVASHSWSHQDLNNITRKQRRDQILKNEAAIRNIIGGFPTYMRPPYSKCDRSCLADMAKLGYHVIYFDVDTADYLNDSPDRIQASKNIVDDALSKAKNPAGKPILAIGHDIHRQTVYNLTAHILQRVKEAGYKAVTVGECLDDPRDNWIRWDYRKSLQQP